jgi:intracellular septation protein
MKLLFDFFPIILFFAAFKVGGIYVATGVAIAATVVQIGWVMARGRRVEPMQWLSLGVIILFGGATLIAHNDTFIKWKPTALYWLMGGALLFGQVVLKRNLLKSVLGSQMEMSEPGWRVATWSWVSFFAFMGVLNLWVAFHYDLNTWVNFKLFGAIGLMLVFIVGQTLYLARYNVEETNTADAPEKPHGNATTASTAPRGTSTDASGSSNVRGDAAR